MLLIGLSMTLPATRPCQAADPAGTETSRRAKATCDQAAARPAAERRPLLAQAIADAEAAVAADDRDALAHFALFCALGEQMRLSGASVSALTGVRRLRREVDRTLELAPDYADALAGKGALLTGLPRLLGGDVAEGERLLRRAIAVEPDYLGPRFDLTELLLDQGRRDDARRELVAARAVVERKPGADDRATLAKLEARLAEPSR